MAAANIADDRARARLGILFGIIPCVGLLVLGGCSFSAGGSGSYLAPSKVASLGASSRMMVDVSVFEIDANLAAGMETQLLTRLGDGGDSVSQWRMNGLFGLSHMPRPHEFMLGYEGFVTAGLSRYYSPSGIDMSPSFGGVLGLPIRLDGGKRAWRSDDLIAIDAYLVPSFGAAWVGFDSLDASAGLALRFHLWSAMTP